MPLVQYYKTVLVRKARRAARQGPKAKHESYEIAKKYQKEFSRAFKEAVDDFFTPGDKQRFLDAYASGSVNSAMASLPIYDGKSENPPESIQRFTERLSKAYEKVIQAAGEAAMSDVNKAFGTNLEFTVKARKGAAPRVPVNPHAVSWMKKRSLGLIDQGITRQQRSVVQRVLADSFQRGVRAESVFNIIKENIGLTDRFAEAVTKRQVLYERAKMPADKIKELVGAYREQLLASRAETIARTETIAAQAAGRNEAWQLAQASGELPPAEREWFTGPDTPDPNAPCPVCEELDGKRAEIGGEYAPGIEMPPAHPRCGCTEILVPAGKAGK